MTDPTTSSELHARRVALLRQIADDLLRLAEQPAAAVALSETDEQDLQVLADFSARLGKGRRAVGLVPADERDAMRGQLTETLRLTFDEAPIGLFLVDLTGRFLRANQAGADILGYSIAELLQRDFQSLTHPEDLGQDLEYLTRMLAGTLASYRMEKRYVRKDGSIVWGRLDVGMVHDGAGRPLHFVSHVQDVTERIAQDAERRKMASVLELTTDFIGMADLEGRLLYHNKAARQMIGLAEDADVSGMRIADMHPAWASALIAREAMPQVLAHGVWSGASALLHRDGTEIPVAQEIMLHRDQAGRPVHLSTIMRDLRAERRAGEQARRVHAQLQAAIGSLNAGFVMYDRDERLVICNKRFQEMYDLPDRLVQPGRTFEEILRESTVTRASLVRSLIGDQPLEAWAAARLAQFRASDATFVHQLGGRYISVQERRTSDGGFVSLRTDITEMKEAEFESALKAELLQVATDSAHIGIWDYNLASGAVVWDERMQAIYGYAPGTFPGTYASWSERLHPDDRAATEQEFRDCVAREAEFRRLFRLRLPGGEVRSVDVRAGYVRDANGRPLRVVGATIDVTAAQESEDRLRLAVAAAESAGRAKAEFLATMSHEIRTPMNGVIGMANLLFKTSLDLQQREYAETIRSCGESLLTLINDILDFSKLEAGRLELERIPFPLHRLVEDVVALFTSQAEAKGVALSYDLPHDLPPRIIGDPTRLRQVLSNLVANAVKFTDRGSVTLRVAAEPSGEDSARIRCTVTDSGIGMAPEALARIGQAFTQADASTTRRFGGSGLGLSIVTHLVTLMGGELTVQSEVGRGSAFTVTIPVAVAVNDGSGSGGHASGLAGRQVVIVSADTGHMQAAGELFGRWAMPVTHMSDPELVRERLMRLQRLPDVLLIDARLPGRTGRELVAQLAEHPRLAGVPHILLGEAADVGVESLADAAVELRKPLRQARLLEVLHRLFAPRAAASAEEKPAAAGPAPVAGRRFARVLVVEDNLVNQRVITIMLQEHAAAVLVAGNGVEAVRLFQDGAWDCIFMDCLMPVMDGFEATRQIRLWEGREQRARTPIIALTANALPGDREACLAAGMDSYLTKPVRASDLATVLGQVGAIATVADAGVQADVAPREAAQSDGAREQFALLHGLLGSALGDVLAIAVRDRLKEREEVDEALWRSDWPGLAKAAHTVKGAAATLRLEGLRSASAELEATVKAEAWARVLIDHWRWIKAWEEAGRRLEELQEMLKG